MTRVDEDLRKDSFNIRNRLLSIKHDVQFVEYISLKFPTLPLCPNERSGSWYCRPSPAMQSVYFKSTDGHFGNWDISMRRLNLHILPLIQKSNGIVIVDTTKKGKRFPDALSKTIPIWIAVLNSLCAEGDTSAKIAFQSIPSIVAPTEAQQISHLLPSFIEKFKSFKVNVDELIRPYINAKKPLKPIFVHPASRMFENTSGCDAFWDAQDLANLDFTPIILVSASFSSSTDDTPLFPVVNSFMYVQGGADDSELWSSPGFKQSHFWSIADQITQDISEYDLKALINHEIEHKSHNLTDNNENHFDWIIKMRLAVGSRKAADPENNPWANFDLIINCGAPMFDYDDKVKKQVHYFDIPEGKKGQKALFESFQPFLMIMHNALVERKRILVHCMQGKDRSVAMAMALLLRYPNLDPLASIVDRRITKVDVVNALLEIQRRRPTANPSRAYMKKIDLFFIR